MTSERRQDVILLALVFSVAAHIGLMYYMRPQVMAQVAAVTHHMRPRGPVQVREAPPDEASEALKMENVEDTEALRDSPAAVAEGPAPGVSGLDSPVDAPIAALAPELDAAALALPVPQSDIAPVMSEMLKVESRQEDLSPIATGDDGRRADVAAKDAAPPPIEDDAKPQAEMVEDIPVPVFEDVEPPQPDLSAETERAAFAELPVKDRKDAFSPEKEVMPSGDVKVVEAEKKAVRDLLDVRGAQDLETFVSASTDSAQEGDWTYFRVTFEPSADLQTVPKDVVVLMDASGSIGRDRLASCRNAARKILRSCTNTGDRFNLVAFRDRFSYAFKTWQECTKDSFEKADAWLDKLAAHGRTDVFATIRSVLTLPRDPARPLIAMVVTDGDANAGVSDTARILSKFTALNDGLVSVYMYGVKEGANRELLDVLTHGNRGESFIYGGVRWNAGSALEGLAEKFRDPVLSDLRVVFTAGSKAEVYPQRLKNLYRGEKVDLVGRVPAGEKEVSFSIKGLNGSKPYEGFFTVPLANATFDAALPGTWRSEAAIDRKLR